MTSRIIGFEGPSVAGKTTLIQRLRSRLQLRGIPSIHIEEFTTLAGGYQKFPPLFCQDRKEALRAARFFLNIELDRKRQIENWMATVRDSAVSFALVDRLIFTCMAIRQAVRDDVGYEAYLAAVRALEIIIPDHTFFVELRCPEVELNRRMQGRILFEGWQTVYDPPGYLELLRKIDASILRLNLHVTNPDDVEAVEKLILSEP